MTTKIKLHDELPFTPKASSRNNPELTAFIETLVDNPEKWAKMPKAITDTVTPATFRTIAYRINNGKYAAFAAYGEFEATQHDGSVWARFIR